MLSKLYKHEFRASAHYFVPVYLACLLTGVLLAVVWTVDQLWQNNVFSVITTPFVIMLFIGVIIAICASTFFINIFRFYKTMVSDEGYLTHTLPVTANHLIMSRLLVAVIYNLFSILFLIVFIVASIFLTLIVTGAYKTAEWSQISQIFNELIRELGFTDISSVVYALEGILCGIASIFNGLLVGYLAVAFAQCMKNHKVLWIVVFYICVNVGYGMISNVITTVAMLGSGFTNNLLQKATGAGIMQFTMITSIILSAIISVVCYIITKLIFEKRLNLE